MEGNTYAESYLPFGIESKNLKSRMIIVGDLAYETTVVDKKIHTSIGGSGYYSSIGAKATGNEDFLLLSFVGEDFDFSFFQSLKISTDGVSVVPYEKTGCFTTKFWDASGKREFSAVYGAIQFPNYKSILKYLNASCVYLAGGDPIRQLHWIKELEKKMYHGIIASDLFEKYCLEKPEASKKVIEKSNIVFMNEEERRLLQYDPHTMYKISIIKKGAMGADIFYGGNYQRSIAPAFSSIAVDTNGAGDILAGAFLSKILSGYDYVNALSFAVDMATLSVTREGVQHILKERE